jgi:prepilin-type N-terminal cleavage/methylation domain-containing protein
MHFQRGKTSSGVLMIRRAGQHPSGFTLMETVVVVMIIGIAAPRLFSTNSRANEGAVRQSLGVIRNAIDTYVAQHEGKLPGADGNSATLTSDLTPYLRNADFPKCSVGVAKNNAVNMVSGAGPASAKVGSTDAALSWMYNYETGEFNVNSTDTSSDAATTYVQF